ncbi:hypothetical protein JCM19231_3456 [Vibrio ishigakensis]|uniref:Lipoprotein n=1 Tax=Vibrio ishigakensis TaxID=1481914 RepID=A0A0B8NIF1_9VIBR|nr:hypothetical protein [Vibrio ishigakensis]GAM53936.1 hypothetical protein JCM19231_3456 [Vibrio ishigakensis]
MTLSTKTKLIGSLVFATALTGCTQTNVVQTAPASSVQVLYSEPSSQNYQELGLITTTTGQTIFAKRSSADIIANMQGQASKLGADAIIVRSVVEGTWGLQGEGTGFSKGSGEALAIKYLAE